MSAMVRQIMADKKTTTSRLITSTNSLVDGYRVSAKTWKEYDFDFSADWIKVHEGWSIGGNPGPFLKVPARGMIMGGDTVHRIYPLLNPAFYVNEGGLGLWVREKFQYKMGIHEEGNKYWYAADSDNENFRYKPSIHMPFTACRLFLKVTGFKAQRIQDISAEDAIAEGIETYGTGWKDYSHPDKLLPICIKKELPVESFRTLWETVHPGSWQRNDWVWSPRFEKMDKPNQ